MIEESITALLLQKSQDLILRDAKRQDEKNSRARVLSRGDIDRELVIMKTKKRGIRKMNSINVFPKRESNLKKQNIMI